MRPGGERAHRGLAVRAVPTFVGLATLDGASARVSQVQDALLGCAETLEASEGPIAMTDDQLLDQLADVFVIWSYEHRAWWRPGSWGYTQELGEAGRYTRADAEAIVRRANVVRVNEVMLSLPAAAVQAFLALPRSRRADPR